MPGFMAIFRTRDDVALTILRVVLGVVILAHGLQKTLGLFGGQGFAGTMATFTEKGMPGPLAFLVILGESAGALGLIVGLLTRVAAFGILCIMLGAAGVHWPNGFFMNWFGQQAGEGFEYHLLAIAIAVALLLRGGGAASIDRAIDSGR